MVDRILFIINTTSATGHSHALIKRLCTSLRNGINGRTELQIDIVASYLEIQAKTHAFLDNGDSSVAIIAGGGSGTLNTAIEAICENCEPGILPGRERVRVATLRMGSGNLLAKQFGIQRDPEAGLQDIIVNIHKDRTVPCCVMRFEVDNNDPAPVIRHAVTLAGFGQFGRIPGDLALWHRRFPRLRTLIAQIFGVERLTPFEYGLALLIRSIWCALFPKNVEVVDVCSNAGNESTRMLAGAVVNFPFDALPFDPNVSAEASQLSFNVVPYKGRFDALLMAISPRRLGTKVGQMYISEKECVEIRLTDSRPSEFFQDENPMVFRKKIRIRVAGTLAFVPGPVYPSLINKEV